MKRRPKKFSHVSLKAKKSKISNLKFQTDSKNFKHRLLPEIGLSFRNEQRARDINTPFLCKMIHHFLSESLHIGTYDLTVHLVGEKKMTELNETVLHHAGSTDVITFDYSIEAPTPMLAGEIFVCVDEALLQSKRFRATWQSEMVRYIVHGVLHLLGHDDLKTAARFEMKREENRLVRELEQEFDLRKLGVKTRVSG